MFEFLIEDTHLIGQMHFYIEDYNTTMHMLRSFDSHALFCIII